MSVPWQLEMWMRGNRRYKEVRRRSTSFYGVFKWGQRCLRARRMARKRRRGWA